MLLLEDGKPVAYASAISTPVQQNYPQIEKEALPGKYGCTKVHQYMCGRPVKAETDHWPLESISKKTSRTNTNKNAASANECSTYTPCIIYRRVKELEIAVLFSRD